MGDDELARLRHDLGNVLTIAQASIDAMLDGVVPVTNQRLERLREIIAEACTLVDDLASAPTARSGEE